MKYKRSLKIILASIGLALVLAAGAMATGAQRMELTIFNSGWVPAPKWVVVSGGGKGEVRMPALFAMIKHPEHGVILYDTGYSTRFYDATAKWPYRLMRYLTPAELSEDLNADKQLEKAGVNPDDVKYIILGHGHVDHVPGVAYFPKAKVIVDKVEWEAMQGSSLKLFKSAYLKSLYEDLPNEIELLDFEAQGKPYGQFEKTIDLWGDGTMILVPLRGHTAGQMGLLLNMGEGGQVFFIGDAAWVEDNYKLMKPPARPVGIIWASRKDYLDTLEVIREFSANNPDVFIVPSHCPDAWKKAQEMGLAG